MTQFSDTDNWMNGIIIGNIKGGISWQGRPEYFFHVSILHQKCTDA